MESERPAEQVVTGLIKWFDPAKGYGFIYNDQAGPDILLHANVLRNFGQGSVADNTQVTVRVLALIATSLGRALRLWRRDGSALAVGALVSLIWPLNLALVEPYLYRQHELMLGWVILLGVSLGQLRPVAPRHNPRPE